MKTRWVIIDTETDGLYDPIHVVEISGQLMEGWEPATEPFRMLLNHDVPIPPEAVAIHGYTQAYLRKHGRNPLEVYSAFREYARDYPFVSHNLSYDWNRCLEPEWARLSIPLIGQRGFCSMMLARRLVTESPSYRLDALKECFQVTQSQSHRAQNDVYTVLELFQKVYRPRLEMIGFTTFEEVAAFSRRTPVAKCQDMLRGNRKASAKQATPNKDQWYYLDKAKEAHGPLPAWRVNQDANIDQYYVWREGMSDWVTNHDCPEFLALCGSHRENNQVITTSSSAKSMQEFVALCSGLIADNRVTTAEVMFLNTWLENAACATEWPASEIAQTLERILEDGKVSKQEKDELRQLLSTVTLSSQPAAPQNQQPTIKEESTSTSTLAAC